eukprot:3689097-Pyramimonas_sp.AAC.1
MVLHAPDPPARSAPPPVVNLIVAEDKEAVIWVVHRGRTPALRHLHRTHRARRTNLDWISETCQQEHIQLQHVGTQKQDLLELSLMFPVAAKTAENTEIAMAASIVKGSLANNISPAAVIRT